MHLPLETLDLFKNEFEKKLKKYSFQTHVLNEFEEVLIIEDDLVLYIGFLEYPYSVCSNADEIYSWAVGNQYAEIPQKGKKYYTLHIEELTYNTLGFKYNHSKFIRELTELTKIPFLSTVVDYKKFRGYTRLCWYAEEEMLVEKINRLYPQLKLRERYESWTGVKYAFVVFEMRNTNKQVEYAVGYTTSKVHAYVISKGREWIKRGFVQSDSIRCYKIFKESFDSWKGKSRQYRLENHLTYIYLEKNFREKDSVWRYADEILERAYKGEFQNEERSSYTRPVNKWVSEELVFNITKKLYKNYNVIYQHRPFFFKKRHRWAIVL